MKRHLHIGLLFALLHAFALSATAQDYFLETLERANRATPYEAVYILSDYQQFLPTFAATYYHLGLRCYNLIPTEHPIRDYNAFRQNLYRTRLYFGNCLHYAKEQTLKIQHYAGLPIAGKKPEYADLERFIRAKMDSVESISKRSEEVYQSYYRLVNRYALCRTLFTTLSERYMREKMAHLLLSEEDRKLLSDLQIQSDSLQNDITVLQSALAQFSVANYSPQFTWAAINLYRLDGLTNTDLLQNNVVLWNYGEWVREFLREQEQTYTTYYDEIDIEYGLLQRAMQQMESGQHSNLQIDEILPNRIERLDYQSFMKDFIETLQHTVRIMQGSQNALFNQPEKVDNDYVEQALTVIYRQHLHATYTEQATAQLKEKLKKEPEAINRYAELLKKWHCYSTDSINKQAQITLNAAHAAYKSTATAFANIIAPTLQPFSYYEDELSGDRFGAQDLQFELEDSIRTILPREENYLVVLKNGTYLICSPKGNLLTRKVHEGVSEVLTAYKLSSDMFAIVCRDDVIFVK